MKYFQVEAGIVPKQQGDLHTRRAKVSTFNIGKSKHKRFYTDSTQTEHEY